ncbi:hypothetical protein LPB41_19640 [Thalassospira sp. MA62]|nr:hypothetical protein [Thalassospira sp. MA62]
MQAHPGRLGITVGLCAGLVIALARPADAMTVDTARTVMDAILMQSGISASEREASTTNDDAVTLVYDDVSLDLRGYSTPRTLALDGVSVTLRDTDQANQVDLDVKLPERGRVEADATSDQRDLTMRNAGGYLRWDTSQNAPVTFDGSADFLIGDEPVTRKHWLLNGLMIQWLPEMARIAWQDAEWTGPNREKRGSIKSTNFVLYPGDDGSTHLDYAHDGLWLPNLIQPRTVRIKSSSTGLKWNEARPLIQTGFNDILTGTSPRVARREIGNALWQKASENGAPVKIDEFYVEARGLEALGTGQFVAQQAARYGLTGHLDFDLIGKDRLQTLLGTPENPTLLGALVPFAVSGLASGAPKDNGITHYSSRLLPDGRIAVNDVTVYRPQSGS